MPLNRCVCLGGVLSILCTAASSRAGGGGITTQLVVGSGLVRPVFVTAPPNDFDRLFIIEKRGLIRIFDLTTDTLLATPFLDIDPLVTGGTSDNSEQGLLGLAFHPDYESNGLFYVNYTGSGGDTRVVQYSVSADPNIADSASAQLLLFVDQPFGNHNAGWLGFGPDGFLYVPLGDGGSACDPGQRAQAISGQLLGKMLRIDVDGSDAFPADPNKNYAIPPSNPFVGVVGDDEIWAYGLRNPWRPSFDRLTGDLIIADVGQNRREEVNFQPQGSAGGQNYGWDCEEGFACANQSPQCLGEPTGCTCGQAGLTDPVHDYDHGGGRCSITGGYVYRGCDIPAENKNYFFADFCSAQIWSMTVSVWTATQRNAELDPGGNIANIVSFGEDAAGELYIVDQGSSFTGDPGEIYKIVPVTPLSDADINRDGAATVTDADVLVNVLLELGAFDFCTLRRADVNKDGERNSLDIQAWLNAL